MEKYIDAIKDFFDRISDSYILNPTKKTVTVAFCVITALICTVSGIFVIGEVLDNDTVTVPEDTTQVGSVFMPTEDEVPMKANIMFVLEGQEKLELLGVMRVDSAEKAVRLSFISSETYCSFNNLSGTMNEHYAQGGLQQLVWAVGELAGISIERYILADYTSFKSILNRIGDMTVNLEHEVICGQDAASLIIEAGQQVLVPEMMTKYFGFLCADISGYGEEIAKTMMRFGSELFCTGNEEDIEKNFNVIVSTFATDISAQDYVTYKNAIKSMADSQVLSGVIVEESLSNLK